MTRNLKVLGLAMVAVFAMFAVSASAASAANGKLTSDGAVTLDGKNSTGVNALTAFGQEVKCPNILWTGHKYNVTPHELIPSGAETVTLTAHYGVCNATGGFPATVDPEGCDYVLHLGETTATPADTYGVKATLICPKEKHLKITVFADSGHTIRACTITITEKVGEDYTGLDVTDLTNGTLTLSGTATGITAHRTGFGCEEAPKETKEAKLNLDVTVEGTNSTGKATAISLSHT